MVLGSSSAVSSSEEKGDDTLDAPKTRASISAPPKFEDAGREAKFILSTQETFDGFRFEMGKTIFERSNEYFVASHGISMGSTQEPAAYSFSPRLSYKGLTLSGKWDTNYSVFGVFHHEINSLGLSYRINGSSSATGQQDGYNAEIEWKQSDTNWAASHTSTGISQFSMMQGITPRLSMGICWNYLAEQKLSVLAGAVRYETPRNITSLQFLPGSLTASYVRKASERSAFATEYMVGFGERGIHSQAAAGFDFQFRMSHMRARVDSDLKVYCTLEEMMGMSAKIGLSGELDHKKKNYRFGLSLSLNS